MYIYIYMAHVHLIKYAPNTRRSLVCVVLWLCCHDLGVRRHHKILPRKKSRPNILSRRPYAWAHRKSSRSTNMVTRSRLWWLNFPPRRNHQPHQHRHRCLSLSLNESAIQLLSAFQRARRHGAPSSWHVCKYLGHR